ncbi:MAG: HAMP domain-containing histidine kinase [Oscillospiraceae bacterium]|jgi:signal transduction histidine kinase|nr:HAMP domain-containing histidine kinase [Oscillospiraceae bacterium]
MAVRRITRRWLINSFGVILVILAGLVIVGSFTVREYYYSLVRQALESRMTTLSALMDTYANDSSADFTSEIRSMVANFEEKNRMELMAINGQGMVVITSSGFQSSEKLSTPDYQEALIAPNGTGVHRGEINGEHVMSLSRRAPTASEELSAIRLSVALTAVDKQIWLMILLIASLGLMVVLFVAISSSYFINSIIAPLGAVGNAAKQIAQGDFQAKIEKKHDDEIGDLADVINYMADELANADKVKNDFISSVSHELRTPLTAIKGWGETLRDADAGDKELIQKGMQVIIGETERLSSMVEDLLDFSRMQTGRLSLIMSRMDLVAELSEAVLMFTERAKREGLSLLYDEPEIFLTVIGDKNRLRQVFVNILDNALKYSDSGDTVEVTAKAQGDFAVITIADTGIGISKEDLPNVKAKFFKANSTRRGSGIGLAVADEIINLHGGKLTLDSVEGKGTTVTIQIPLSVNGE